MDMLHLVVGFVHIVGRRCQVERRIRIPLTCGICADYKIVKITDPCASCVRVIFFGAIK